MKYFLRYYLLIFTAFILAISSCAKESPTVNLGDYVPPPPPGGDPGYFYPFVSAVYPTGTGVPVNTDVVIIFNMPVLSADCASEITATGGGGYSIITDVGSTRTARIDFAADLPGGTVITVNVGAGIREAATGTVTMLAPYSWNFTTGTAPDTVQPTVNLASRNPADLSTDISLTAPNIQLDFSEAVNPTTINSTNFYLHRVDPGPVYVLIPTYCGWSPVANPTTATLSLGQALEPSSTYRVTVTTGITDLSGNPLSAGTTWTFTTVDGDPFAGVPTITGPTVPYVSSTTANIVWTTSEATDYALHYGQGDDTATTINSPPLYYSSTHSYLLDPLPSGLSSGRRYYVDIDYSDYAGNPGATSTPVVSFNTETNEVPSTIDTSFENQLGLNWITRKADVANTGAFMTWRYWNTTYYSIYGQRYNSSLTAEWNGTAPLPVFTEANQSYSISSMVEDVLGGMIVTALRGNQVRVKRLDSTGAIVEYGAGTLPTSLGLQIDAGGANTNASAVPVYSGVFTQIGPVRATEMGSLGLLNRFVDFDVNLSGLTNGYVIMDQTNHDGTTIDNSSVTQDYRHILGQNANLITSGDTYFIGDNVTNTASFTARNHAMNSGTNYTNGGNTVYTEHNFSPAWLNVGDIIRDGANYGRITGIITRSVTAIDSGAESADRTNHLIDGGADFFAATAVVANDVARNTGTGLYTNIIAVTTTDLTLAGDNFPLGTEGYQIYQTVSMGTATGILGNLVYDTAGSFNTDGVIAGDIVVNLSDGSSTTVAVTPTLDTELDLDAQIFAGTEAYRVVRTMIKNGTANPNRPFHLIDGGATWFSTPVAVGDLVVNTSGVPAYAFVTAVTDTDLTLDADIFSGAGNNNYEIYHEFCTTHTGAPSIQPFLQLTVNWAINVANGQAGVTLYNYIGVTGTADTPRTNPLYDDGVDLSAVAANDIILNYTDGTWTFVNNITYSGSGALGLNADIMSDGDTYAIVRGTNGVFSASNILDIGSAQGGTGGTTLVTDNTGVIGGPIAIGDIAYNYTDNDYAMVTNAVGATLTLSRDAGFIAGDRYVIVRGAGVLYAWQNGTNINASVRSLTTGTAITSASPLIGPNMQNPILFPDGKGNAYLVYQTTAGQLRVRLYNAALQNIWGGQDVDTQNGLTEAPLKVIGDNADGIIVLYQYNDANSTIRVQRIRDNSGAIDRPWGGTGYSVGNTAAQDVGSTVDIVGDATNGVIVTAQIGNNIWANRVTAAGATPWVLANRDISTATGNQRNPKIFVNSAWTIARILWEDDRFSTSAGYGIFGMQVNAGTGAKNVPAWRANTSGTNDDNGVAVVLNSGNKYWPLGIQVVPYNNGLDAALIWEDWRNVGETLPYEGSDLLYIDIEAFTPY